MGVLLHFQAALIGARIQYYPWLDIFLAKITPKSAFQFLENIFQDRRQRLLDRMKNGSTHPDLLSRIQDHNQHVEKSEQLSNAEIEQNALAIMVGGSETLTTVFAGAMHHLLANPTKLEKLVEEIGSTFSHPETEITASTTAKLPYLNAVIDETLRLCPPIPDALRRLVPSPGATIAGHPLPDGTTVSVSCYTLFRSSTHFSDPEVFAPERFL
jgi:cytochrome P450